MKWLKELFSSKYGKWELIHESDTHLEEVTDQVADPRYCPKGCQPTDPVDFVKVGTGVFVPVKSYVYRKVHRISGKPKFKTVKVYL